MRTFDVRDFASSGAADDTAAIQAAVIAAQASGTGTVFFPPSSGGYKMGRVTITQPVTIDLGGQTINLSGLNAGFYLSGSVANVTIRSGTIVGSGVLADNHIGVLVSGKADNTSSYENFIARDLVIQNVVNGMILDGINDSLIENVTINGTVGASGATPAGNGIGFGGFNHGSGGGSNNKVIGCTFIGTTWQGLYLAGNKNTVVADCVFMNTTSPSVGQAAFTISRSQNTVASNLAFYNCAMNCIEIDADGGAYGPCKGVKLSNIAIYNPPAIAFFCGVQAPWQAGVCEVRDVSVDGLLINFDTTPQGYPVQIGETFGLTLSDVEIRNGGSAIGGMIRFIAGEMTFAGSIKISGLNIQAPAGEYVVTMFANVAGGTQAVLISDVLAPGITTPFPFLPAANPNIRVNV